MGECYPQESETYRPPLTVMSVKEAREALQKALKRETERAKEEARYHRVEAMALATKVQSSDVVATARKIEAYLNDTLRF